MRDVNLPLIYEFSTPASYLGAVFQAMNTKNAQYSVRAWARSLKLKNPTSLYRVLNEERPMPLDLAVRLATWLELNADQTAYFELLALGKDRFSAEAFSTMRDALIKHEQSCNNC